MHKSDIFGPLADVVSTTPLEPIVAAAERNFFCGFQLANYLDYKSRVIHRVQGYLDCGLCYDLAPLSMVLLRDFPSATVRHGYVDDEAGRRKHAWVTFEAGGDSYIMDMAQFSPAILPAKFSPEVQETEVVWSCDYDTFWHFKLSQDLARLMADPLTSFVRNYLAAYSPGSNEDFGFQKEAVSFGILKNHDGKFGWPHYRNGRPISDEIIIDFVKYPAMIEPHPITYAEAKKHCEIIEHTTVY